ncbi:hypothetical protein CYLTODRAFT_166114 [Cylindrobasidium torrendii FP15055 ss-10]|uniref:F-box domain-containing protein n=1 Tax=Cylindrobasidium torrendii FP15055 ss-10 TaxID=1314674 RepID=A0A0D7AXZ7_9AGAR|nr:hypothetical protein CYLTODRAFT_166114 [Cylindrobasidium torrendii FP15055 ss-10]
MADVFTYFNSNPGSAARIRSLSLPSPFYSTGQVLLENMLLSLPHLKELRVCITWLQQIQYQTSLLRRLEKLVFDIGARLDSGDANGSRLLYPFKFTLLGVGSTEPCLELWYRNGEERMLSQWRRSANGAKLEAVYLNENECRVVRPTRRLFG